MGVLHEAIIGLRFFQLTNNIISQADYPVNQNETQLKNHSNSNGNQPNDIQTPSQNVLALTLLRLQNL